MIHLRKFVSGGGPHVCDPGLDKFAHRVAASRRFEELVQSDPDQLLSTAVTGLNSGDCFVLCVGEPNVENSLFCAGHLVNVTRTCDNCVVES